MKSGVCPKCGSMEVRDGSGESWLGDKNVLRVTFWMKARLQHYVCVECGYIETYVAEPRDLDRIAWEWPPANKKRDASSAEG
jgi:predicted nucleic-acid-binding Zn-ribbon protein